MISLINDLEIIFVLISLYHSQIGIFSMIGSVMVTMATELFCLNKLQSGYENWESLFFILPKDVAVFTKNLSMKKINGNNFVQLSLFKKK
jgi:hypothetical protein